MKRALAYVAAVGVGLFLLVSPFLRYAVGGSHAHVAGPHSDHGPRHGGQLVMVGDHHLELVEHDDSIEIFVSDAMRRPVRLDSCNVSFDGAAPVECAWRSYRNVVGKPAAPAHATYDIRLPNGPPLTLKSP